MFPQLLSRLQNNLEDGNSGIQNLRSGFQKSGLHPVNHDKPKSRLPHDSTVSNDLPEVSSKVPSAVYRILSTLCHGDPSQSEIHRGRRKKVNIKPGENVLPDHLLDLTPSSNANNYT